MTDLASLISTAIERKTGNKEFALFYDDFIDENCWTAEIGNPNADHVSLGEVQGEFRGEGKTPEEAVAKLIEAMP